MDIQDLRIISRVAAVQNLTVVGQEFGLTAGTISKRIQSLEDTLSVRLFDRTTRSLRITQEGETFLAHAEKSIEEMDMACGLMEEAAVNVGGRLRVLTPAVLDGREINPALTAFMHENPEIELSVEFSNRQANLQDGGFDVALRVGALTDSALIAKWLTEDKFVIVGAPGYLKGRKIPATPRDLERHRCVILDDEPQWSFKRRNQLRNVRVSGPCRSHCTQFLLDATRDGLGMMRVGENWVRDDLRSGRLVRVLEDYEVVGSATVWAVHASSRHVPPRLRSFLDFLGDWFSNSTAPGAAAVADVDQNDAALAPERHPPSRPKGRGNTARL